MVLNVGTQCIGSIFKDPKRSMETAADAKWSSYVKTQRTFDKAYKQSIRLFHISLMILYMVLSWLSIYLSSNTNFSNVLFFEQIIVNTNVGQDLTGERKTQGSVYAKYFVDKCMGVFLVLLSSLPFSFSNIIHLLILFSTNFAEWDIDVIPSNILFRQPHATLAFGKVAHMFFGRSAIQRDDKQSIKLFYVGGHFFKNQQSQKWWEKQKHNQLRKLNLSFDDSDVSDSNEKDDLFGSMNQDEMSLDYFPNELQFSEKFTNTELDDILSTQMSNSKEFSYTDVCELFRAICLCHQVYVIKEKIIDRVKDRPFKYIGVMTDEISSVEFAYQQGFKLMHRKNKILQAEMLGQLETFDELGVVTTKAVNGHFLSISAVKVYGSNLGILYMKGSISAIKDYFQSKDMDLTYLNKFNNKFVQAGLKSIVYARRILTLEETNLLIITMNEGVSNTKEQSKIEQLLRALTKQRLQVLGIIGIQKSIHLRNRVVIDDMILNGVKPWIISSEVEQSNLVSLNSLRVFQGCYQPIVINGNTQKKVMDQILSALRTVITRMEETQLEDKAKNQVKNKMKNKVSMQTKVIKDIQKSVSYIQKIINWVSGDETQENQIKEQIEKIRLDRRQHESREKEMQFLQTEKGHQNQRNCICFTGIALSEIFKDHTMQKTFMTLAYISDLMVGSEIAPLQKQKMITMAKNFIGEGEYTSCIVSTPEDQFMVNEADVCVNLQDSERSSVDFQAMVDVTIEDFSAMSYLLFKHGNQIQLRLSKAVQAFIYKTFITVMIIITYMISSGFSAAIPYLDGYYLFYTIILSPLQILNYSVYYKDYGNECFYRIFGHYKYNFAFTLVEYECLVGDLFCAFFDWIILYITHEIISFQNHVTLDGGKITSVEAYNCYQVILLQSMILFYFLNTNQIVWASLYWQFTFFFAGCISVLRDEGLEGVKQLFLCPQLMFTYLWQLLVLFLRNIVTDAMKKLLLRSKADLLEWYTEIEGKLAFEEFENINQIFSISQYQPLYNKITNSTIERTLKLINKNMIKCTKSQELDTIIEKINVQLDYNRRGQLALTGAINKLTLQFNDLNKEAEYQENKNQREITYIKKQLLTFIVTTLSFSLLGGILFWMFDFANVGVYYYIILSMFSAVMLFIIPHVKYYISKLLLAYTIVVIGCYTVYTSGSESLQPVGLIFVLALVAGLNHSYVYPTIAMILLSVLMFIFFNLVSDRFEVDETIQGYRSTVWMLVAGCWGSYVYFQELEKKIQFVRSNSRVKTYIKLKQVLNMLVPNLVRDRVAVGKKNHQVEEGEATVIYIIIENFDMMVQSYKPKELIAGIDKIFKHFDQLCDQHGIQRIESIGKRFLACGGLKTADSRIDSQFLNKHHSVRVADFALDIVAAAENTYLTGGSSLRVKIGIHTGHVTSVVLGELKPQFSLIGNSILRAKEICNESDAMKVSISINAQHYLDLYTNNIHFEPVKFVKGKPAIYEISTISTKVKINSLEHGDRKKKLEKAVQLMGGDKASSPLKAEKDEIDDDDAEESQSEKKGELYINQDHQSHDESWRYDQHNDEALENDSNKSDRSDDEKMNVFGFNDDLGANLDDRIIIQNPTENAKYNLVERPKYLLQFEGVESEQEFLFKISKQEARKTCLILILLMILNKVIILGDILEIGQFTVTPQFVAMFPILAVECMLIYKLNNPVKSQINFWTAVLSFYGVMVLILLISLEIKYIGFNWQRAAFNELLLEMTLSFFFFMRNIFLRHFVITYVIYIFGATFFLIYYIERIQNYQSVQFGLGQFMYFILLCVGIHHREMIQRKSLNYERVLNVETTKTNEQISSLIPSHQLAALLIEQRIVDEFQNMTILFIDVPNFSQDAIKFLQKLFTRFDQLTVENKVFKVQTVGDTYIIIGFAARIDKSQRNLSVQIEECNKVLACGLQMIESVKETKSQMTKEEQAEFKHLEVRVGVHTGNMIAGLIGSKLVKYDIFGEAVLMASKMRNNATDSTMCVSEETKNLLAKNPKLFKNYEFEELEPFEFAERSIKKFKTSYMVKDETDSEEGSSDEDSSYQIDSSQSEMSSSRQFIRDILPQEQQLKNAMATYGDDQ